MQQPIDLQQKLTKIISQRQIKTLFQPILNLDSGQIVGYEAFSRGPVNSPLHKPFKLFATAQQYNKLFELEQICYEKALINFEQFKKHNNYKLFVNITPQTIQNKSFKLNTNQPTLKKENIIIELTKQTAINNPQKIKLALDNFQNSGYKIALDDIGIGYSGLQFIVSLSYNFIKLDPVLVKKIDQNPAKKNLINSITKLADKINAKIIAEGIEQKEELNLLTNLGVDYGQGYLFASPQEKLISQTDIKPKITGAPKKPPKHLLPQTTIGELASTSQTITVNPTTKNKIIADQFEKDNNLHSVIVLADKEPLGLIMRDDFYFRLGSQYGYAIFINKPVQSIMNQTPLTVDCTTSLSQVSQQAMDRNLDNLYDSIIVTDNDKFWGTVSIENLLNKFTELQIEQAKNLNPLTNLPGNRFIKREIADRINSNNNFSFLYIDLDNFKVYNDCYGYQKGDEIIKFTANLLKETINQLGNEDDFVGHIGGDDFVIITKSERDQIISQKIIEKFNSNINQFFNQEDKQRGYMIGKDRQNNSYQAPLTSLSIAIVSCKQRKITSPVQVSDIAAEIKQCVKKKSGSNFMKDRRKD